MKDNISIIINSLLYILNKFKDKTTGSHQLFKILYFAEQKHLSRFGKPITNDNYIAMEYGPVPSIALDIIKCNKKGFDHKELNEAANLISTKGYYVTAIQEADVDWLSISERKCLDESVEENIKLSFGQLTDKSHDSAWNKADHSMDLLEIAKAGGANKDLLNYISSKDELKNIVFK